MTPTTTDLGLVRDFISKADAKLNSKIGYSSNQLADWFATLMKTGSVEVGWRESCGSTDMTTHIRREWIQIVKKLERVGVQLRVERVKHNNSWATKNGGFWNSEIFTVIKT